MNLSPELLWLAVGAFAVWKLYPYVADYAKAMAPKSRRYPEYVELLLALGKIRDHCEQAKCSEGVALTEKLIPHILGHSREAKAIVEKATKATK